MDLHSNIQAVRQRWWLVLAIAVLAVGIGGAITLQARPKYASTVTFFVNTPYQNVTAAYQGSLFTEDRVKSYVTLLASDRLAQSLAADPSLGLTAAQISGRITAVNEPNTVLLKVTVTDTIQTRALKITEALTKSFPALVQEIETPPGSSQSTVKIEAVDGPLLEAGPVSPRPARNLTLAALLGLLLGIGAAVLRERLDNTVRSDSTLHQASGAAVLGQIPFDSNSTAAPLIVGSANQSARAEAIRKLRTNLRFIDIEQQHQIIALTSPLSGEGKTTTCCNLAIALAETGLRVLLIDADLRRPRVAEYLGLDATVGLTNVLIGDVSAVAAIQQWGDGELHVLASGSIPPNPSELLGSQRMADLLAKVRDWADIVLIDTPPLLSVTDGAVVAAQADGTVLLSRYGKTTQPQVAQAARSLQRVSARLLGCVLTMTKTTRMDAYYHGEGYRAVPTKLVVATSPGTRQRDGDSTDTPQDTPTEARHTLTKR